jgi:glycosyltransferase involved in cell wall biosynthesis
LAKLKAPLERADVLLIQGIWTFPAQIGSLWASINKVPFIVSARGCLESRSLSEKSWKKSLGLKLYARRMLKKAAAIHFTSQSEKDSSLPFIPKNRTFIVENGFIFGEYTQRPHSSPEKGRIRLGIVGRIHPRKGFDIILPALGQSPKGIELDIIGSDENLYKKTVEEIARTNGVYSQIKFKGLLRERALDKAFQELDYLIVPSHGESFGNTVIEALSMGIPVIITPLVPVWEFIQENELGLITNNSVEDWAATLSRIYETPMRWDGPRLSSITRKNFDFRVKGIQMKSEILASL